MFEVKKSIGSALGMSCLMVTAAHAANYAVTATWPLPGPAAFDYMNLDSTGSRLFVTRFSQVDVLDSHTGKVLGSFPASRAHGVVLLEAEKRGYATNGNGNTITEFDLDTYKVLREIPVSAQNPDALVYDAANKHWFTFNGTSKDVSVLDAATMKVIKQFKVPAKPEFAQQDTDGTIYVNLESEPGQMVVIDTKKLEVKATWDLPGCNAPSGLALDRTHHRLFSVCDDKVMAVTDSKTGKQVAKVEIGDGPDAVWYDPKRALIFTSNGGDGTLSVVHQESADKYKVVQTVKTKKGARTMALDYVTGDVYLPGADFPETEPASGQKPVPKPDSFVVLKVSSK